MHLSLDSTGQNLFSLMNLLTDSIQCFFPNQCMLAGNPGDRLYGIRMITSL